MNQIFQLDHVTELLQYFTSGAVTFAELDNSIAATGIGSGWTAGDRAVVSGSGTSGNNTTHILDSVASGKLIATSATTIGDDNAGETVKINQEYRGSFQKVDHCAKLVGGINCSGDCTVYVEQSQDGVNVDYSTTVSVTGGTAASWSIDVLFKYARLRIVNGDADQTTMRAYLNGRTVS